MYKRIVHYLQGSQLVQIQCACPERVLNLLGAKGILFWDLQWESEICLRLRMLLEQGPALEEIAGQTGAEMTVLRRRGIPVLWGRFHRRYVLLAGFAVFWLLLFGGNLFIWEFRVSGNETVPTETVLRALENYGITVGSPGLEIDQEDMRNHVLLELKDVVWLAVNVKGCVAQVQVVERVRGQAVVEDRLTNVVARCPGLVTRVEALGGQAMVLPGATVTQGQLLISGAVDLDNGGLRWQRGMGRVWARTWYELTAQVPLTVSEKGAPVSSRTRYALDIGKKRIKFYGKGSTLGADCDKIIRYHPVTLLWGLRLPITVVSETVTSCGGGTPVRRPVQEARDEGEALLRDRLTRLLADTGTAESVRVDAVEQGGWLTVTLRAECLEEIGREVPLTDD